MWPACPATTSAVRRRPYPHFYATSTENCAEARRIRAFLNNL
ncbi:MAG: hypothetical protein ACLSHC_06835 [Bilophila wadsworthia]